MDKNIYIYIIQAWPKPCLLCERDGHTYHSYLLGCVTMTAAFVCWPCRSFLCFGLTIEIQLLLGFRIFWANLKQYIVVERPWGLARYEPYLVANNFWIFITQAILSSNLSGSGASGCFFRLPSPLKCSKHKLQKIH